MLIITLVSSPKQHLPKDMQRSVTFQPFDIENLLENSRRPRGRGGILHHHFSPFSWQRI